MENVTGYIDHIIYQNETNGYTVLQLTTKEEELICVGSFRGAGQGDHVKLTGNFVEHNMYGSQFKVSAVEILQPEDAVAMERYLASGALKGVGPALAARIVKQFGDDTFRIMEEEPERLSEIKGISDHKAREISAQMEEKKELREAMVFLQNYGISNNLAIKIYNTYGSMTYSVLRENPYKLAEDVSGVGFKMADEIASKIGIHVDSEYRVRSGILYTLLQASADGNIYLPREELLQKASGLLGLDQENMDAQLSNLAMERKVVIKGQNVYASNYYYAELNTAKMLHDLNISMSTGLAPSEYDKNELDLQRKSLNQQIKQIEEQLQIELDDLQREAVFQSICNGILILSGGPGTGKTTTINTMIHYFESEGMDIFLAAPTGRAAKRMTEATGYEARTIHRMLELNGATMQDGSPAKFERNEENPLEADVIIIDEMSMVDIFLFQSLLKAVPVGTRLILVGDASQLPSVGPGQVLRDLINVHTFPTVMLQKIFRQAEESDIVMNAHRINRGEHLTLNNKSKDFFFLERKDVPVIYKHMVQLISEKLPRYVNAGPYDIQVLTPMRKGALGVETLNQILQQYLNPPAPEKKEYLSGSCLFREGDKVMQIRNNYQLEWEILSRYQIPIDKGTGVFNGDMGVIKEINEYAQAIIVEFDEMRRVTYPYSLLDELELAYAITIHKAQGSEYPAVVMPLLNGPKMLFNRNLLYTGVTRARNCVTILGSSAVLQEMIDNVSESTRYTSLDDRIREFIM